MFGGLYLLAPEMYTILSVQSWLGLAGFVVLLFITEWYSIDLYTKSTSLSTSAVPILAGTLLFGPIAAFILSLTYALSTSIKHRSPPNRFFFNFSNQLFAGMLYTTIIAITGTAYIEMPTWMQLIFAILAAIIGYVFNTGFISVGVYLDTGCPIMAFWKENYSWLYLIFIGMGIVAAAFGFGYKHDPLVGSLLVIVPLLLLRVSQVQYVERTKEMVVEMRKKNSEITNLNDGLLDTLAEIIDLRDPYVLGHSQGVTQLAMAVARRLGLHEWQVELVRKGSLLHDIGKLGIPQSILAKPGKLTTEEFETIKSHPELGAALLEKSSYLRPLIPIVGQHHEYFNGEGYPDKLAGNQIAIEARIVSVADAIEAMSADRPYREARSLEYIVEELERCSGTQFDPQVTKVAIEVLKGMEAEKDAKETTRPINSQLKRPTADMQII
jgi:putative nucleotidyltransferase with HDIG domain